MAFTVIFKPLAQLDVDDAYVWYQQDHIKMGAVFLEQLGRTSEFLSSNPYLYPCVVQDLRRANLNQFPYALFYVIDGDAVSVLACMHHHRDPKQRPSRIASLVA